MDKKVALSNMVEGRTYRFVGHSLKERIGIKFVYLYETTNRYWIKREDSISETSLHKAYDGFEIEEVDSITNPVECITQSDRDGFEPGAILAVEEPVRAPVSFLYNDAQRAEAERIHLARKFRF